jgi:hypothetical protein
MILWIERHCPPGINGKGHFQSLLSFSCVFAVIMIFHFGQAYYSSYCDLFIKVLGQKMLDPNAVIPDFVFLHAPIFPYILSYTLVVLFLAFTYHSTYYRGSKSIYLMKRLPNPWERWRLCLTLPTLALLFFLLILVVMLLLTFAFYLLFTPESALSPQQGQKFWAYNFRYLPGLLRDWFFTLGGTHYA